MSQSFCRTLKKTIVASLHSKFCDLESLTKQLQSDSLKVARARLLISYNNGYAAINQRSTACKCSYWCGSKFWEWCLETWEQTGRFTNIGLNKNGLLSSEKADSVCKDIALLHYQSLFPKCFPKECWLYNWLLRKARGNTFNFRSIQSRQATAFESWLCSLGSAPLFNSMNL